jgi:hypothetical protein
VTISWRWSTTSQPGAAAIDGAAVSTAAELGHRDRLPEPAVGADQAGEPRGVPVVAVASTATTSKGSQSTSSQVPDA